MGKGGSQTTTQVNQIDPELEKKALENIAFTDRVAEIGYVPNQGPTLAGFAPQQLAAMQGYDQAASAFGMPSAVQWQQNPEGQGFVAPSMGQQGLGSDDLYKALTGMQPPNASVAGVSGYSAFPLYEQLISMIPEGQRKAIESFVMNPQTGQMAGDAAGGVMQEEPTSYAADDPWAGTPDHLRPFYARSEFNRGGDR